VTKSNPNAAHYTLAYLSDLTKLREHAPKAESFHLITQNIDGLSLRALHKLQGLAPTSPVPETHPSTIEMHGRLFEVICTSSKCGHSELDFSSPICEALRGNEDLALNDLNDDPDIPLEDLPRCGKCGELARPGVVWFGETPRFMDRIYGLVDEADMCIVVGTSATVRGHDSLTRTITEMSSMNRCTLPLDLHLK
jgi:NAD+-dependent protein deacetylase sirtuin 5